MSKETTKASDKTMVSDTPMITDTTKDSDTSMASEGTLSKEKTLYSDTTKASDKTSDSDMTIISNTTQFSVTKMYSNTDHDNRDNCADSNDKPEQQVGAPEYRALVAEIRQLKNHMASVTEGAGGNNRHIHKPSGGGEYSQNRDHEREECQAYTAYIAGIKNDNCYSDDVYIDEYYSDGDIPDSGGGDVSNEPLINPGLD